MKNISSLIFVTKNTFYCSDWLANQRIMIPNVAKHTTWAPPHNPWYKVNDDDAIFEHLEAMGVGVVAQDHVGQCVAAMSKKL